MAEAAKVMDMARNLPNLPNLPRGQRGAEEGDVEEDVGEVLELSLAVQVTKW